MAKGSVGNRIRVILAEYNDGYQNGDTGIIVGFEAGLGGAEIRIDGAIYYSEDGTHYLYPQEYEIIQEEVPIQDGPIPWQVGQEVWDVRYGKGIVDTLLAIPCQYPIGVVFTDGGTASYTSKGLNRCTDVYRSLFFSDPKIVADTMPPKKPFVPVLNKGDIIVLQTKIENFVSESYVYTVEHETEDEIYCLGGDSYTKRYWTIHKLGSKVEFNV